MHGLACELLAQLGYEHLLGFRTVPYDEDSAASRETARRVDNDRVRAALLGKSKPSPHRAGVKWMMPITWPDRLPLLVPWSGQQTLQKVIRGRQGELKRFSGNDVFAAEGELSGGSGIDPVGCVDAIDAGFSPRVHGMLITMRPGVELLAIVGAEVTPIVSHSRREYGFVARGREWRFDAEPRADGYQRRWGELRAV